MVDSFAHESIGLEYRINLKKLGVSIKGAKKMLDNFHASIVTGSKKVEQAFNTVTDASKKMGDQQKKSQQVTMSATAQLGKMGITSKTTTKDFQRLNFTTLEYIKIARLTTQQMKELTAAEIQTGKAGMAVSASFDRMGKRLTHTNFMIRKQKGAMGDSQRAMERWSLTGMKAMAASQLAWLAMGSVIFGVMAAIGGAIGDVIQLHQRLKNLQAVTQAETEDMKLMETAIRKAAVTTKFFAADMADAAVLMAQAGFSAQEVANSIGAVAVLASATGRELKDVADLMTSIIRAYDLNASEATRVVNVLAAAISESKLQIDTLITALNFMGVAAHQFNISLEDTVAWLGILRDRGMKASTIGTSFRGVLATLVRETDKFNEVLAKLKMPLGFADVTIRAGRTLEETMRLLAKSGWDVVASFQALPRRTAMTFSLMVKNIDAFRELQEEITNTNRAFDMNIISMQGLDSQLKQTKSIFDEFIASLTKSGGVLEPIVAGLKLIVQLVALSILSIATYLNIAGQGLAMLATAVSEIKMPKVTFFEKKDLFGAPSVGAKLDFSESFPNAKELSEQMKKNLEDTIHNMLDEFKGILGEDFSFFGAVTSPEDKERIRKTKETLDELNEKRAQVAILERNMAKEEEGILSGRLKKVGEVTAAWGKYREELVLLTKQIQELQSEGLGLGFDEKDLFGPVKTLDTILLDLAKARGGKREDFVAALTKGKENLDLMTEAVKILDEEIKKLKRGEKADPSLERTNRIIRQIKEHLSALKEVDKIQKKTKTDTEKEERDRIRLGKRIAGLMSDGIRDIKKRQKEDERSAKLIERQNLAFDRLVEKRKRIEDTTVSEREKISEGIKKILLSEYDFEVFLINKNAESRRRDIEKRIRDAELLQKKLEAFAKTSPFFREAVGPEIERLSALVSELKELFPDIDKRRELELGELIAPRDFVGGIKKGLKDVREEFENEAQAWKDIITNTAQAMTDGFSDLFFNAMTDKLVSLGDAWTVFSEVVRREIANMTAKWLTSKLFGDTAGNAGWVARGVGFIAGLFGIGGGGLGLTTAHQGGIISAIGAGFKQMHSGGEVTRRLRVGEYVLRKPAARSLGEQNLNQMNRTGQMPQQQRVVNNYNTYVQAMDVATFDTFLRNSGSRAIHDISLNSVALGRRRRDPRVR